jgi:hypothetical protein
MPPRDYAGAGHSIGREVSADRALWRPPELRVLKLPPQQLFISTSLADPGAGKVRDFYIRTPAVQCRTLINMGVEFEPTVNVDELSTDSSANGFPAGWTLWCTHLADLSGRGQVRCPVENIRGTRSTPAQLPTDASLFGHKIETQSAGGLIFGRVTLGNGTAADANCSLWLTAEFHGVEPMSDQEWRNLIGGAGLSVPGGALKVT